MKRYLFICVLAGIVATFCASCAKEQREDSSGSIDIVVLFSSDLLGKIRSCGCTDDDSGGLGRMTTYIEKTRKYHPNILVLNAGDAFDLDLSFSKQEAELTWDAFDIMELDAFTPGEIDFIFGLPYLEELAERTGIEMLAANIVDAQTGEPILGPPYKVVEFDGRLKVAITGVLDESIRFPAYIDTDAFDVIPVKETLERIVPLMEQEADFLILLSHLGRERSFEIAADMPVFDIVIVGHGQPLIKDVKKVGETFVVGAGSGEYMGRMDLTLSGGGKYIAGAYKLAQLKEEIAIHEGVRALFEFYGITLSEKEEEKRK